MAAFLGPRAEALDGAPRALVRALEEAGQCAAARKRNAAAVTAFLSKHGK